MHIERLPRLAPEHAAMHEHWARHLLAVSDGLGGTAVGCAHRASYCVQPEQVVPSSGEAKA